MLPEATHTLTVLIDETRHTLVVPHGANLRRALLDAGLPPLAQAGEVGAAGACGVRAFAVETVELGVEVGV